MASIRIRKTVLNDSLELSGLSQFKGQEVEIIVSSVPQSFDQSSATPSFMRFAGIAAEEMSRLEGFEDEITANRALDLQRLEDL